MVPHPSLLLALVDLIDVIPTPPVEPRRGRPPVYSDRLFLKALVIMLVRNGAVLVYQLTLLHRHQHGQDTRVGLKAFLKAA